MHADQRGQQLVECWRESHHKYVAYILEEAHVREISLYGYVPATNRQATANGSGVSPNRLPRVLSAVAMLACRCCNVT